MEKIEFNGVQFYSFESFDSLVNYVDTNKGILIAINARKINYATDDTRAIINRNIGYCDGVGAVFVARKLGDSSAVKLPGCELWLKIIEKKYKSGASFYLIGGTQDVIVATIDKLRKSYEGINIVGFRNGYIKTEEEKIILKTNIIQLKPDVVFVAMGSPKQEFLMEELHACHPAIYQGLGGSFDVYIGKYKRAPQWFINHNLEWLYRFFQNPSRINRVMRQSWFVIKVKLGVYKI